MEERKIHEAYYKEFLNENIETLNEAHKHHRNKEEILKSKICGCFYCLSIFQPTEIVKWVGRDGNEALCPKCNIDSVIGDLSGFPITKDFLHEMEKRWFLTGKTSKGEKVYWKDA